MLGDGGDDLNDLPNLGRGLAQLGYGRVGGFRHLYSGSSYLGGLGSIFGDFLDASAHLFGPGGYGLQILTHVLGRIGHDICLR